MKAKAQAQARRWLFTLNNYTAEEERLLKEKFSENFSYLVFGHEVAPTTGTPHLQGYFETLKKRGPKGLAKSLPGLERATLSIAKGTADQNRIYCTKDDDFIELGTPMKQGNRSDLIAAKEMIDKKARLRDVEDAHFATFVRHRKFFVDYKRRRTEERNFKTRVCLFVGPPGKGKSTLMKIIARRLGSVYHVPAKKGSGLYFDDYDGEDVMIIDEFDGNVCPPTFFNGLADEHPFVLPAHGSAGHQMVSKFLFVGSNYAPKFWWKSRLARQVQQATRRIEFVFKVGFETLTATTPTTSAHELDRTRFIFPLNGPQDPTIPIHFMASEKKK